MSFFVAAGWSIGALFLLDFLMMLLPAGHQDLVGAVLCQGVAYLIALVFLMLVHEKDVYEKDGSLSETLGLRRTSLSLCFLAAVIGLALQGPLTLIADAIYHRFPVPEQEMSDFADLFRAPLLYRKVALVLVAGVVGPAVEEIFFRGALYRGLRRQYTPALTLFGVALLFAASHRDARNFLPDLLGGLAMGYVRAISGSLWPALLLHAAFNTISVVFAVRLGPEADVLSRPQSLAATFACLGLVALYRAVALRSETCAQARAEDAV
jgi:membrane protease YdiL (CAAX protease family)